MTRSEFSRTFKLFI